MQRIWTLAMVAAVGLATSVEARSKAETCDILGVIAGKAQEFRMAGNNEKRTTRLILREKDLIPENAKDAVPNTVHYVFLQDRAMLEQDLGEALKEACLAQ